MFTGIVTAVGRVQEADDGRLRIACPFAAQSMAVGGSIACDGCCLTVTAVEAQGDGCVFDADVSNETRSRTTLADWRSGRRVNLERPLRLMDELGGHLVQGHVDGTAELAERLPDGGSVRLVLDAPDEFARFIAFKGSVALDGVSLTVSGVEGRRFAVNIVPHTLRATTLDERRPGDRLNLEVDLLARYVARISGIPETGGIP